MRSRKGISPPIIGKQKLDQISKNQEALVSITKTYICRLVVPVTTEKLPRFIVVRRDLAKKVSVCEFQSFHDKRLLYESQIHK